MRNGLELRFIEKEEPSLLRIKECKVALEENFSIGWNKKRTLLKK